MEGTCLHLPRSKNPATVWPLLPALAPVTLFKALEGYLSTGFGDHTGCVVSRES